MAERIVTLITDFGLRDWFVGVVHGVILARAPGARIVDVSHDIPAGDVGLAAFVLEVSAGEFPAGTIHVAVVDPGVGTPRRALCVEAREQIFLGPDNGILEAALGSPGARVREIAETRYLLRHPPSRTFHARDVFAPAAAHLCCDVAPRSLGPPAAHPVRLNREPPRVQDGTLFGAVAWTDRFGNCITNIVEQDLARAFPGVSPDDLVVGIGALRAHGLSEAYAEAPLGSLVALIGSSGHLELALYGAHAAGRLGVAVGDAVWVRAGDAGRPAPAPQMVWR